MSAPLPQEQVYGLPPDELSYLVRLHRGWRKTTTPDGNTIWENKARGIWSLTEPRYDTKRQDELINVMRSVSGYRNWPAYEDPLFRIEAGCSPIPAPGDCFTVGWFWRGLILPIDERRIRAATGPTISIALCRLYLVCLDFMPEPVIEGGESE